MTFDKYTQNAQAAIADSQSIALEYGQQQLEGEHLHLALMRQNDGMIPKLLDYLGIDKAAVQSDVEQTVDRLPKVSGSASQLYA